MKGRRDTIACFFESNTSTPTLLAKKGSSFAQDVIKVEEDATVEMDISSPVTSHLMAGEAHNIALPCLSPAASQLVQQSPIAGKRRSMRHRDSIACFFESPKYCTIVSNDDAMSGPAALQEDASMELENESEQSKFLSHLIRQILPLLFLFRTLHWL